MTYNDIIVSVDRNYDIALIYQSKFVFPSNDRELQLINAIALERLPETSESRIIRVIYLFEKCSHTYILTSAYSILAYLYPHRLAGVEIAD